MLSTLLLLVTVLLLSSCGINPCLSVGSPVSYVHHLRASHPHPRPWVKRRPFHSPQKMSVNVDASFSDDSPITPDPSRLLLGSFLSTQPALDGDRLKGMFNHVKARAQALPPSSDNSPDSPSSELLPPTPSTSAFLSDMEINPRVASFLVFGIFCHGVIRTYLHHFARYIEEEEGRADMGSAGNPPHSDYIIQDLFVSAEMSQKQDFVAFMQTYPSIINSSTVDLYLATLLERADVLENEHFGLEILNKVLKRDPFNKLGLKSQSAVHLDVIKTLYILLQQYTSFLWKLREEFDRQWAPVTRMYLYDCHLTFIRTLIRLKSVFYTPSVTLCPTYEPGSLLGVSFLIEPDKTIHNALDDNTIRIYRELIRQPDMLKGLAQLEFIRRSLVDYILPGQLGEAFLGNGVRPYTSIEQLLFRIRAFRPVSSLQNRLDFIDGMGVLINGVKASQQPPEDMDGLTSDADDELVVVELSKSLENAAVSKTAIESTKGIMIHCLTALLDRQVKWVAKILEASDAVSSAPSTLSLSWDVRRYLNRVRSELTDIALIVDIPAKDTEEGQDKLEQDVVLFANQYFETLMK